MIPDALGSGCVLVAGGAELDGVARGLSEQGCELVRLAAADGLTQLLASHRPDAAVVELKESAQDQLDRLQQQHGELGIGRVPILVVSETLPGKGLSASSLIEWVPWPVPTDYVVGRVRCAIDLKRLIDHGERRYERLASVLEISRALTSTLDSGAILYVITRKLSEAMELGRCSFIVPDLATGIGRVIACKDDPNIQSLEINLANYPEIIHVLRTGERIVIEDVESDPIMAGVRKFAEVFRDQSIMTLPLKYHDDIIGVLQIRKKSVEKGFVPREIEYCELLANAAANALKNAQLYEDIEKHNSVLRRQKRELEALSEELQGKNQDLVDLERQKADFTAMIVHDLRSPLMIVQGVLDLLENKHRGNPGDKELIEDGIGVTKKMLSLIRNLLEVSKLEAGELRLERESIELDRVMREVVAPFQVLARTRGITLSTRVEDGLTAIHADRGSLYQIIDNLVSNAFQFTPDDGRITVVAEAADSQGGVRLTVADTGAGIPASEHSAIFKRFRQGRTRKRSGTGLGLNIVDLLVTAHGGRVNVTSREGEGSRFDVTLPGPSEAVSG